MSTPLIERLRAGLSSPPCNADGTYTVGNCSPDVLMFEAAAEIERLRDELNLCCALKREYQQQAAGGIERLCEEIERLRADAARYRWLTNDGERVGERMRGTFDAWDGCDGNAGFDGAIDAAMRDAP